MFNELKKIQSSVPCYIFKEGKRRKNKIIHRIISSKFRHDCAIKFLFFLSIYLLTYALDFCLISKGDKLSTVSELVIVNFSCLNLFKVPSWKLVLKVSKSQKQFMVSSIWTKCTQDSILSQCISFVFWENLGDHNLLSRLSDL